MGDVLLCSLIPSLGAECKHTTPFSLISGVIKAPQSGEQSNSPCLVLFHIIFPLFFLGPLDSPIIFMINNHERLLAREQEHVHGQDRVKEINKRRERQTRLVKAF